MVLMLLMSWAPCIKFASEWSSVCLSRIRDWKLSWCDGLFFYFCFSFPLSDFTGCVLQRTDTFPRRWRAVPAEHGVGRSCAGYQTSLRHPVGLEDLGQGRGNNNTHPSTGCVALASGDSTQHLTEAGEKNKQSSYISYSQRHSVIIECMGKLQHWIWFHPPWGYKGNNSTRLCNTNDLPRCFFIYLFIFTLWKKMAQNIII